ncbi:MAG TPA: ABC transporter ATP-binding protein [Chloroflexota bacterium]|nr:ABC transporter ATP-binding protein [Chloroflexota bacterium]
MEPLIEVEHVSRLFRTGGGWLRGARDLRAVDDVSLAIAPGSTVALVGESGSGKSTLGRLLLRLVPPSSGAVRYRGRDVASLRGEDWRSFRREVQVVFQDSGAAFNARKTIGASLQVPLRYNVGLRGRQLRERAAALLDQVGLDPAVYLDRYPHELSGGQRQRVGVARAMASEPQFVVADEPVSALDVSVRAHVLQLLRDLQRQSPELAYLFITHDLGVVRAVADQVQVMYLGAIVERGPVAALFGAPGHPYTRALLAATPVPEPGRRKLTTALRGDIPTATDVPGGCRFHTRCPLAQAVCRETSPPWVAFDDGVESACHFATDVRHLSPADG